MTLLITVNNEGMCNVKFITEVFFCKSQVWQLFTNHNKKKLLKVSSLFSLGMSVEGFIKIKGAVLQK